MDFQINKKISEEVASIPTKRLRNKIAGFVTHLMRRIQHRPVRGISLKLQEEERERRMDFIPDRSELDCDVVKVDADTIEMLKWGLNNDQMIMILLRWCYDNNQHWWLHRHVHSTTSFINLCWWFIYDIRSDVLICLLQSSPHWNSKSIRWRERHYDGCKSSRRSSCFPSRINSGGCLWSKNTNAHYTNSSQSEVSSISMMNVRTEHLLH